MWKGGKLVNRIVYFGDTLWRFGQHFGYNHFWADTLFNIFIKFYRTDKGKNIFSCEIENRGPVVFLLGGDSNTFFTLDNFEVGLYIDSFL